jgi:hypothetical protein
MGAINFIRARADRVFRPLWLLATNRLLLFGFFFSAILASL